MATQKSTQTATDLEALLAEIAATAYLTEELLKSSNHDAGFDTCTHMLHVLRHTVRRLGWMADMGLKRIDSINCMHDGDAASWLLSPMAKEALAEVVHG